MATTITKTIKSSGGDYTTVGAWEAAQQGDLVVADEIRVGECHDINQSAAVTIDGSTTDATRYLMLTVAPAARHAGVYTTSGKFYWTGTSLPLTISDPFTRVAYLQVRNTHASSGNGCIRIDADSVRVEQCIIWQTASGSLDSHAGIVANSTGANALVRNCVSYANRHGFFFNAPTGCEVDNCTCVANSGAGIKTSSALVLLVKNSYLGGNATRDLDSGGSPNVSWTITTSMASDALSSETGLTNSIAYDTTNFTNVTAGSEDLHLPSGSALKDAGTDLSGSFTIDIDGQTRSGTWDVGADERVSGGQTVTLNQVVETDVAQPITVKKTKALAQATETDLAQSVTSRKLKTIGQTTENDLAQPITRSKQKHLGQTVETDTAQAIARRKQRTLGLTTETDLAQPISASGNTIIAVGQVSETDLAQPVARLKRKAMTQASETDQAQPLTARKLKSLGVAIETDLAQALARIKSKSIGQALEVDLAQPLLWAPKRRVIGQVVEIDLAQPITVVGGDRLITIVRVTLEVMSTTSHVLAVTTSTGVRLDVAETVSLAGAL